MILLRQINIHGKRGARQLNLNINPHSKIRVIKEQIETKIKNLNLVDKEKNHYSVLYYTNQYLDPDGDKTLKDYGYIHGFNLTEYTETLSSELTL